MSAGTPPNTPDKKGSPICYFEEKEYSLPKMTQFLEANSSIQLSFVASEIQDPEYNSARSASSSAFFLDFISI
ncbi:hypothetical protein L3Y34_013522 [Caenorhabditis briggsae]|uniref:Uncharacterized protein n=1 Tax=Caenorhabditis briggsae TaxID=6238 RepID=A0AAE8ZRU8_CAEBR|nr:hypothetical protein L3Y34_013522 [Caenorhabditis briggsae]